jgi:penicillin amidase
MLNEKEIFGLDDFKRMILDQHSNYAELVTPFILRLNERKNELSAAEQTALATLTGWDYDMNANLVAPSVFEYFRMSFADNLLADELGDIYGEITGTVRDYYIYRILNSGPDAWVDNVNTPQMETLDDIILRSFKNCISDLSNSRGTDQSKWEWGSIHKIVLEHPLGSVKILDNIFGFNSDQYSIGGSSHTVSPYSYGAGFRVNHGASERHIFNTANWDESYTIIPTGESGVPSSEFYLSQTESYLQGRFYKDAFSEGAVKAAAKYTLVLKAEK